MPDCWIRLLLTLAIVVYYLSFRDLKVTFFCSRVPTCSNSDPQDDDATERHRGDLPDGGGEEEDGHQLPGFLEPGDSLWLLRGHSQLCAGRHLDALL